MVFSYVSYLIVCKLPCVRPYYWAVPKSSVVCVLNVLGISTPFQIFKIIVFLVTVFMVDNRKPVMVWLKRFEHYSMNSCAPSIYSYRNISTRIVCSERNSFTTVIWY